MTSAPEPQIELDIQAFVNGQLDAERRYAVMEYLSSHPERAADVMADMRLTEGLRLAVAELEAPSPLPLRLAADRLANAISQKSTVRYWRPFAAAMAMFALGWAGQGLLRDHRASGDVAAVFDTALDAQDAVLLRASLSEELGPMPSDPEQMAARLGIELPDLPQGWSIRAAQVVSTPERPGLALVIDSPDLGGIMLFGVLLSFDGPDEPAIATIRNGRSLAFFEREKTAFVLVDALGTPADLRAEAEVLRHRFN